MKALCRIVLRSQGLKFLVVLAAGHVFVPPRFVVAGAPRAKTIINLHRFGIYFWSFRSLSVPPTHFPFFHTIPFFSRLKPCQLLKLTGGKNNNKQINNQLKSRENKNKAPEQRACTRKKKKASERSEDARDFPDGALALSLWGGISRLDKRWDKCSPVLIYNWCLNGLLFVDKQKIYI